MNNNEIKYELVTGFKKDGQLQNSLVAGSVYYDQGLRYYRLKLMMFPGLTYYMVKNRDSADKYTVYSKIIKDHDAAKDGVKDSVKFQNPVGSGFLDPKLQSHLEIRFPVLRSQLFMSLFESN